MEHVAIIILIIEDIVFLALILLIIRMNRKYKKQKATIQLMENKVSISQIRPHFLYNCLNSIYYLCDTEPERAKIAISDFSEFLRDDLEALSGESFVPFSKELQHIKRYVSLEQLRAGDLLNFECQIEFTDFEIPVLSVQPLVENAIKHGLGKKKEGGTVILKTEKKGKYVFIIVQDDGIGFDTKDVDMTQPWVDENGKKHVGLSNSYARLSSLCDGKLQIESEPGNGTIVIAIIPYKHSIN